MSDTFSLWLVVGVAIAGLAAIAYQRSQQASSGKPVVAAPPTAATAEQQVKAPIALAVFGGLIWFFFFGGWERETARTMSQIEKKVADDAVAQYNIAKGGRDPMALCVQAGMVAAAYLRAKAQANYNWWKEVERGDCAKAGIRR